jgi:hypothetical protein
MKKISQPPLTFAGDLLFAKSGLVMTQVKFEIAQRPFKNPKWKARQPSFTLINREK